MPEGLTPSEIDDFVVAAVARGEDLYHLDEGALSDLDADLVVTQDLCAVCAVDVTVVDDALAHLGCTADVLTIDPHTLDEVFALDRHPRPCHGSSTLRQTPSLPVSTPASPTSYAAWRTGAGRASCCSSGPTRRSPPATGSPR